MLSFTLLPFPPGPLFPAGATLFLQTPVLRSASNSVPLLFPPPPFGKRQARPLRIPLCIRDRYCRFPSYFVLLCARAKSVLATQRNLKERFSVDLVKLSVRHWGSQVRTESFDKFGSERPRQLSQGSQDGFRANGKEKEVRGEKDSTGSGSRRWEKREGKKAEEEEGKKGIAKETQPGHAY